MNENITDVLSYHG